MKLSRENPVKVKIIGAGPAGMTIAYFMTGLLGEKVDIEFFEASDRIGGQSLSVDVDGVLMEMGTVYQTVGYTSFEKIQRKLGIKKGILFKLDLFQGNTIRSSTFQDKLESLAFIFKMVPAWFYWFMRGQMFNPTDKSNALLYSEWLKQKKIKVDKPIIKLATDGQLYGPADKITKHNAFMWSKPSLWITAMRRKTKTPVHGWEHTWKKMKEQYGKNWRINYHKKVESTTQFRQDEHVFVTTPLEYIKTPLNQLIGDKYLQFKKQYILSIVAKIRMQEWKNAFNHCRGGFYFLDPDKRISSIARNLHDLKNGRSPAYVPVSIHAKIPDDDLLNYSEDQLVLQILDELRAISQNEIQDIQTVRSRLIKYNYHWSKEQLLRKIPQKVYASHGQANVWYSGGGLSHWNISDITNYNIHLVSKFVRSLPGISWSVYLKALFLPFKYLAIKW